MAEENAAVETKDTTASTNLDLPAFYGVKAGMTRIFNEKGEHVPVTVVKLIPNVVTQVKSVDKDGYSSYQLGYYEKRGKLVNKPKQGHLKKAGVSKFFDRYAEVKVSDAATEALGKEVTYGAFSPASLVDVTGTTKGKGFQGVIKRYGFSGGPASHGSKFHRSPGSIGNCASPGKVVKGKKLPGHMGAKTQTVQNVQVVEVNTEKGYMLLKGSVPGSKSGFVRVAKAVKK